jgi:hypothetical protein
MADRLLPGPARRWIASVFGHDPVMAANGIVVALSLSVTAAAMMIDQRQFQGDSVWLKPLKFQVALLVYLLTLAAYARWLPARFVERPSYRVFRILVVAAVWVELAWIGGAAMFGVASHYNTAVPFMARLYPVMGILAILLTSASLVQGIAIWRNDRTGLPPSVHLGLALGLVLTFVLTVPAASILSAMPGHSVGSAATGARLPLFGWSREAGDLRVAHFLATHALHLLPLVGLALAALVPARTGRIGTWLAGAAFAGLVALVLAQALAGRPLVPIS